MINGVHVPYLLGYDISLLYSIFPRLFCETITISHLSSKTCYNTVKLHPLCVYVMRSNDITSTATLYFQNDVIIYFVTSFLYFFIRFSAEIGKYRSVLLIILKETHQGLSLDRGTHTQCRTHAIMFICMYHNSQTQINSRRLCRRE